jgi:hypothetical protein
MTASRCREEAVESAAKPASGVLMLRRSRVCGQEIRHCVQKLTAGGRQSGVTSGAG